MLPALGVHEPAIGPGTFCPKPAQDGGFTTALGRTTVSLAVAPAPIWPGCLAPSARPRGHGAPGCLISSAGGLHFIFLTFSANAKKMQPAETRLHLDLSFANGPPAQRGAGLARVVHLTGDQSSLSCCSFCFSGAARSYKAANGEPHDVHRSRGYRDAFGRDNDDTQQYVKCIARARALAARF